MLRHLVTALGALAWLAAIALVVGLRATRRAATPALAGERASARAAIVTARVAGTVAGAFVAGALVLGLGSRLLMRVLAATSSDSAQGRLTDAEEVVGDVTVDGTIGLVIFVGLGGGLIGAALFGLLRRWLPDRSVLAGLVTGGIGAGLLARPSGLLDPENRDFAILDPVWLAVALALGLVLTVSLLGAVLMDRWAARWPLPGRSVAGVFGLAPLLPLLLVPPAALAVVGVIALRTGGIGIHGPPGRSVLDRGPRVLVAAAGALGAAWTIAGALDILST